MQQKPMNPRDVLANDAETDVVIVKFLSLRC